VGRVWATVRDPTRHGQRSVDHHRIVPVHLCRVGHKPAGLLASATWRRGVSGGSGSGAGISWETIRTSEYTYYDTAASFGTPKDLKTAIVNDASGNVIDESYYRYYTAGSGSGSGSSSGSGTTAGLMEYAFGPEAFARLTAALGTSIDTLTDSQVAPYADKYLEYDPSHERCALPLS